MKTKETLEALVTINLNKPQNLVFEDLLKPDLPRLLRIRRDEGGFGLITKTGKNLNKYIPAFYYLVHLLLERQHARNDKLRCLYAKDYVKMFSRDIEPFKSKNDFRYLWSILVQFKVFQVYDVTEPTKYKKSAKGYYFKLTDTYRDAPVVQHQVIVKQSIADQLRKLSKPQEFKILEEAELKKVAVDMDILHQYRALQNIRFDSIKARLHAEKLLANKVLDINQYNSYMVCINNLLNGRIKITKSAVCNRIYTPITGMPKELRQFLIDSEGNKLLELDFGCFNAFLVYAILNESVPEYESNAEKIAFENELDLYRRLLSGGDFYMDFKAVCFPNEELSRDQIKSVVLKNWFNGRPDSRNTYRKHLLKRMPRISAIIDSFKADTYENFSHLTMSLESALVNGIIYKKFIAMHPDAIMYTIFDSFLIEQKYSAELLSIMLEEGSRYFSINCIVKARQ